MGEGGDICLCIYIYMCFACVLKYVFYDVFDIFFCLFMYVFIVSDVFLYLFYISSYTTVIFFLINVGFFGLSQYTYVYVYIYVDVYRFLRLRSTSESC